MDRQTKNSILEYALWTLKELYTPAVMLFLLYFDSQMTVLHAWDTALSKEGFKALCSAISFTILLGLFLNIIINKCLYDNNIEQWKNHTL